uniref:Thiamine diphosphokinase n=1 Tax=Elaeophora elaphi TaxID=1147741 RepID=A0A0R3S398_9BILA
MTQSLYIVALLSSIVCQGQVNGADAVDISLVGHEKNAAVESVAKRSYITSPIPHLMMIRFVEIREKLFPLVDLFANDYLGANEIGVLWLNSKPEQSSAKLARHLWNKSRFRGCTDGAANFIMLLVKNENCVKPDLISGDFDSITTVARQFFESEVEIVETPDQDYTDMCKALQIIAERMRNKKLSISKVIVLGGLCGRFDHVLSSLNSLLRFDSCETIIIDGVNLVTILREGSTSLEFTGGQHLLTGKCGVIPFVQRETVVSSSGLKWNLDNTELAFGKLISTSNEMVSDTVAITCTAPVVFTLELSEDALLLR